MRSRILAFTACLLALCAGSAQTQPEGDPLDVAITIGMVGDLVETIGGPCVRTTTLIGPGVDPHLYRPSARDVQALQRAELILYSGYSLEGQLGEVLARFATRKPTLAVTERATEAADLIRVQGAYGVDPHLWMDVGLWAKTIPTITAAIAEQQPACAAASEARAAVYAEQLAALHDWVSAAVASIPPTQRILITAHDAFGYYGRAYGIEVTGIQGISTESEAGIADIRQMAQIIAERQVPAVFVESTINPRTVQAVVEAAADLGQTVAIGGQLYSDAMGETGTAGGTYIGMLYENTANIVRALGGRLPPLPVALHDWAKQWGIGVEQVDA